MFVAPVSVAVNVGIIPRIGLLKASFNVIVTLDEAIPSATVKPLAMIVDVVELGAPTTKVTVVEAMEVVAGVRTRTVLTSALVDFKVQVEFPLESVVVHNPIILFEPVEEIVGVSPAITLPLFLTLTKMLEVATPSASTFEVAEIVVV
jgi:hypothetical protein